MLQRTYSSLPPVNFKKKGDTNDVTALLGYKDGIELVYVDGYKRRCYPVLAALMVDYKQQVLIIDIKANMQCSICHVLPKKRELITRLWESGIYHSN